jgi:hypothetical protein
VSTVVLIFILRFSIIVATRFLSKFWLLSTKLFFANLSEGIITSQPNHQQIKHIITHFFFFKSSLENSIMSARIYLHPEFPMVAPTEDSRRIARCLQGKMKQCPYGLCLYAEEWQNCSQFLFIVSENDCSVMKWKGKKAAAIAKQWNSAMEEWVGGLSGVEEKYGQLAAPVPFEWQQCSLKMTDGTSLLLMNSVMFAAHVVGRQGVTLSFFNLCAECLHIDVDAQDLDRSLLISEAHLPLPGQHEQNVEIDAFTPPLLNSLNPPTEAEMEETETVLFAKLDNVELGITRVRGLFEEGFFDGTITSFDPRNGYYRVLYEDGDECDYETNEIISLAAAHRNHMLQSESQIVSRCKKPKLTTSHEQGECSFAIIKPHLKRLEYVDMEFYKTHAILRTTKSKIPTTVNPAQVQEFEAQMARIMEEAEKKKNQAKADGNSDDVANLMATEFIEASERALLESLNVQKRKADAMYAKHTLPHVPFQPSEEWTEMRLLAMLDSDRRGDCQLNVLLNGKTKQGANCLEYSLRGGKAPAKMGTTEFCKKCCVHLHSACSVAYHELTHNKTLDVLAFVNEGRERAFAIKKTT